MHLNSRAHAGPAVHPFGIGDGHVYTAGAHRGAEIVVPPRAMDAIALIKIHHPGYVLDVITWSRHILHWYLDPDLEFSRYRWRASPAG